MSNSTPKHNNRAMSGRRTRVADSTLERWFESPLNEPSSCVSPLRQNTCAVQTTCSMVDVELLERLVGASNEVGVLTAAHAVDRQLARQFSVHVRVLLMENEARARSHLEDHMLTTFALLGQLATASALRIAAAAAARPSPTTGKRSPFDTACDQLRTSRGVPLAPASPTSLSPSRRSIASEEGAPTGSPISMGPRSARGSEDVDKLKYKIHMLEHRVRSVVKMEATNHSPNRPNTSIWVSAAAASLRGTRSEISLEKRIEMLSASEAAARCDVDDVEYQAWRNLELERDVLKLEAKLRCASRVMVHAPFTSYRPKIPIAHSLAGEEYLRRWILVETLHHYEHCATFLQHHENDLRNAIGDEEESMRLGLRARCFLPYFTAECSRLNAALSQLGEASREQRRRADSLYATLQLRVIVEQESMLRIVVGDFATSALNDLQVLNGELGLVRGVHALAKNLEKKLFRQQQRHREEVQFLISQLPRHGIIHPNVGAIAQLYAIAAHGASVFSSVAPVSPDERVSSGSPSKQSSFAAAPPPRRLPRPGSGASDGAFGARILSANVSRPTSTSTAFRVRAAGAGSDYWAGF